MTLFRSVCLLGPLFLLLGACSDAPEQNTEEVIRPVKLFTVSDQNATHIRRFPAEVIANQGSYLAFRVNGELVELPVLAGQEVRKGQLLAKLDPTNFQLQYDERKARFELAEAQLARIRALVDKNIASRAELDEALANKQVAEAALNAAKTNLDYTALRAPFGGTIAKVYVKNFENIVAKQNILRLETRDRMDVVIHVPEKLVARVNKDIDYRPDAVFDGFPDKTYPLTIKEWDTQADPVSLTYKVVFSLPVPEDFNLLAGMTGEVLIDVAKITAKNSSGTLVPVEAVFSELNEQGEKSHFVWVFDQSANTVARKAVEVGALQQDSIEIISPLAANTQIVAAGVHYLKAGQKVRPWRKERGL